MSAFCFYLLSVDAESTHLGGDIFAVGGVLGKVECFEEEGKVRVVPSVLDRFYARCPLDMVSDIADPWVLEHVVPVLDPETHTSQGAIIRAAWDWLEKHTLAYEAHILVDVGFPVEARLFSLLMKQDRARAWVLRAPVLELAMLLLESGLDPMATSRASLCDEASIVDCIPHHPTCDAEVQLHALRAFDHSLFWRALRANTAE